MTGFDRQTISDTTAKMLLEVQAVHFNADKPYIFTSGWASPVYIDCRKLISYPRVRRALMEMAETTILRDIGYEQIDAVAGGETAGIPFAAWLSDRLMVPMQYVRKKPKGFGRNAQIEGLLTEGQRVLLVEDLTTDSRSKINFINALRTAGAKVNHCFVLFHYNIFKESVSVIKPPRSKLRGMKCAFPSSRFPTGLRRKRRGIRPEEIERYRRGVARARYVVGCVARRKGSGLFRDKDAR